jgi:phage gp29-like protein
MIQVNKRLNYWNMGVSFTPSFYKRAYSNYQLGILRDVFALIDRAEIDEFIAGCLTARHAGYKRSWDIAPASDNSKDIEVAAFVKDVFESIRIRDLQENIVDAKMKQYSVIDLDWKVSGGSQVITGFKKWDQIYFRIDPFDNQIKIDMGSYMTPIEPDSALVVRYGKKMIMLTILKAYIRKEFGEESWSSFLEMFGEPYLWAEYPIGLSDPEKKNLEDGITNLGASARGIVPAGTKVNITESHRSTGDHKDYKEDVKSGISLALLGHEKASGGQKAGLQIGGNLDAFRVMQHVAIDDIDFIEEEIQALIKMLVDRNYLNIAKYPKFKMDKSDAADSKDKLAAVTIALNAGAEIDPAFFDQFGLLILNKDIPLKKQPMFPGDNTF